MISKHKTYLLPGRNEGHSKSTFRQLRISTLWTSKGYPLYPVCIKFRGEEVYEPSVQAKVTYIQEIDVMLSNHFYMVKLGFTVLKH